jgi:hypothetical protein
MKTEEEKKAANREYNRTYRIKHRGSVAAYNAAYHIENRVGILARKKAYRAANAGFIAAHDAARAAANRSSWEPVLQVVDRWHRCEICGATEDLVFHHFDPATKLFEIGKGMQTYAFPDLVILAELAKTGTICRAFHTVLHSQIRRVKKAMSKEVFDAVCAS